MTATAHALVAGMIAGKFPGDLLTVSALSLASHFLLDAVPHWDFGTDYRSRSRAATGLLALADTACGIGLAYWLFGGRVDFLTLTAAVFFSELPDWAMTPWFIYFSRKNHNQLSQKPGLWETLAYYTYKYQETWFHKKAPFTLGVATQLAAIGFFYLLTRV